MSENVRMYDELGVIDGENGGMPEGGNPFPTQQEEDFHFHLKLILMICLEVCLVILQLGLTRDPFAKGKKPAPAIQTINITLEQFYLGHNLDININRQTFCPNCEHYWS